LTAIELNKRLRRLLRAELPIAELFSANVMRLSTQLAAGVESAAEVRSAVLPSLPADPYAPSR
jgi:hypothetical protein